MAQHNELGKLGEKLAEAFLLKKGYDILERNYRYDRAEIDLLAMIDEVLVVVEVKTRSTSDFGLPHEFISKKKIRLLVKAVDHYLIENQLDVEVRFDAISVLKGKKGFDVTHIEDAFYFF